MKIQYSPFVFIASILLFLFSISEVLGSSKGSSLTRLRIGDATIVVSAPEGFIETSANSPELWLRAQSMTSGYTEIIANFITKEDFDVFGKNDKPIFLEYFIVSTPKANKSFTASQQQFDKIRADMASMQSDLKMDLEPKLANEVNKLNKNLSSQLKKPINISVGQIVPVSVNINRPNLLSYSYLAQLSTSSENGNTTDTMIITSSFCFLKGKVLMVNYYRLFQNPKDLEISRKAISDFSNNICLSNK